MKSTVLVFYLIFSSTFSFSQTSVFHSFFDNTEWRVDAYAWHNAIGCYEHYYYHYYLGADSTINGLVYKKVYKSDVLIIEDNDQPCYLWTWIIQSGYMGSLREDPVANKVYFVIKDSVSENVFFDYNIIEGDTIPNMWEMYPVMTVDSLDSVLVNSSYRKRWNFHLPNLNYSYIIEGIGHSDGFIERYQTGFPTDLVCVKENSTTVFDSGYDSFIGCNLINGINEIEQESSKFSIVPNPFTESTLIKIENPIPDLELKIYNSLGELVLIQSSGAKSEYSVERGDLKSGFYYFVLADSSNGTNLFSEKVIIVD